MRGLRAYGWDVDTRFSSNRGEVFPPKESFGHTGFTGTSIWIDPTSQTAVIFLSNRVHPKAAGNINRLRGEVATLAARACGVGLENAAPPQPPAEPDAPQSSTPCKSSVRERHWRNGRRWRH
ncbi:MAG TPA: serine hydrolase [Gemmataceae bacterium]|nr:serine hydrolase [Gemmataceae bacterium]